MTQTAESRGQGNRRSARWKNSIRYFTFGASAIIAAVVLLAAGVDPHKWYGWLHQATPAPARTPTAAPLMPRAVLPRGGPKPPEGLLPGTQSSISAEPHGLILTGIVSGRSIKDGYAMLGTARENPQTYAVGALLANGARLAEIHPKYVVLDSAGRSARLYLEGSGLVSKSRQSGSNLLTVGGASPSRLAVVTTVEPLTDYLRPAPVYEGAMLVGYQVYPGTKAAAFTQMGLQSGDVITAIDGAPLSDAAQSTEVLRGLMNGEAHAATVARKGQTVEVRLDGALILADQERDKQRPISMVPATVPGS